MWSILAMDNREQRAVNNSYFTVCKFSIPDSLGGCTTYVAILHSYQWITLLNGYCTWWRGSGVPSVFFFLEKNTSVLYSTPLGSLCVLLQTGSAWQCLEWFLCCSVCIQSYRFEFAKSSSWLWAVACLSMNSALQKESPKQYMGGVWA